MPSTKRHARTYLRGGFLLIMLMVVFAACGGNTASTSTSPNATSAPSSSSKISLKELNLGVIPSENVAKVEDTTKPFADALSQQLGIPVHLFVGTNYTAVITAMSSKQLDVAWFGPLSYVLAADKANAQAIARQLTVDGADHYYSYIITTPKTGIKTMADLKGRTFSFVDPASTSGNLMPRYAMVNNGLDPDKDVKGTYTGGHDISLLSVLSGKVDAGAVASDTYQALLSQGKFKESDLVIVNKSVPIPESPIAVRKDLSQNDKDLIQAAFLAIKDKTILKAVEAGGFVKDSDGSYDFVRDLAKKLNLDLTKLVQ